MIPKWEILKPEAASEIQDGRRHLEFHIIFCHFIANCPISTEFCIQMHVSKPQIKKLKREVNFPIQDGGGRHLGIWENGYNSGKYWPILMKFCTQTQDMIPKWESPKPEAASEIQIGRRHHLEFHIISCHFIAICPISTKFCTHVHIWMPQIKNPEIGSEVPNTRWLRPPSWIFRTRLSVQKQQILKQKNG